LNADPAATVPRNSRLIRPQINAGNEYNVRLAVVASVNTVKQMSSRPELISHV